MRWMILAIVAWPALVWGDRKLDELKAGYQREAAACHRESDGVGKVAEGAAALAKDLDGKPREDLDREVEQLVKGHVAIAAYCDEVDGVVTLLSADDKATYRSLEHALDERDNKIRKLRQASKKIEAELEPISHRLIPRINARAGAASSNDPHTSVTFPSGHTIVLPSLAGTWRVSGTSTSDVADYADKTIAASVIVRAFAHATCEQQRRTIPSDAEHVTDLAMSADAKQLGVVWLAGYTRRGHAVHVGCARHDDDSGWTLTVETSEPKLVDELGKLGERMLARFVK